MAKLSTCEGQNYLRRQAAGNRGNLRGSHNLRRQLNLPDERRPPRQPRPPLAARPSGRAATSAAATTSSTSRTSGDLRGSHDQLNVPVSRTSGDLRGSHDLLRQLDLRNERQPPPTSATTSAGSSTSGTSGNLHDKPRPPPAARPSGRATNYLENCDLRDNLRRQLNLQDERRKQPTIPSKEKGHKLLVPKVPSGENSRT